MTYLTVGLVGGLAWVGLRGDADPTTFAVGVVFSVAAAWATRLPSRGGVSPLRVMRSGLVVTRLVVRFSVDLSVATARQVRLVLSPALRIRPRWVRFATRLEHPATRVLLGVMISLTPGTVTEELRGDEYVIHVLDAEPDEDPVAEIRDRFESLLVELEALLWAS